MRNIFLVYRDNDMFAQYIGKLAEVLGNLGYNIKIKNFPRGTQDSEIKQWILANEEELKGKIYFSDDTCSLYRFTSDPKFGKILKSVKIRFLDSFFQEVVAKTVVGDDEAFVISGGEYRLAKKLQGSGVNIHQEIKRRKEKSADRAIPVLVSQIIEKMGLPNQISIVASHYLLSHEPFSEYDGFIPLAKEKLSSEDLQDAIDRAVSKITEWLVKGGVPKERISVKYGRSSNKAGNWVIFDRHEFVTNQEDRPLETLSLQLPLPNFFQDAMEYMNVSVDQVEKNLTKVLADFFEEEEE